MSKAKLDVVGIGNAIVDVIAKVKDNFLEENDLEKGIMTLINYDEAMMLYEKLGKGKEVSGGSAANTLVALASMGGNGGFIGKVANDELGSKFIQDIRNVGVEYDSQPMPMNKGIPTSHSLVMVTPDASRTMCTALGASTYINPVDVDAELIKSADVTYLEGYLFDRHEAKSAFKLAADIAHAEGKQIALTLSDPFCVERHRDEFLELIQTHVDILFANEAEIKSLYRSNSFLDTSAHCKVAVITRSAKGSIVISKEGVVEVMAEGGKKVVDTTGAGDLYAAGFLYGYTRGMPLDQCGKIASVMAGEIITHLGARPEKNLEKLLKSKKLI